MAFQPTIVSAPDAKRKLLKRRMEHLVKIEQEEKDKIKQRRENLQKLVQSVDLEYNSIADAEIALEDLQRIMELRNKELAKLDSDVLFNDPPASAVEPPAKHAVPKSGKKQSTDNQKVKE